MAKRPPGLLVRLLGTRAGQGGAAALAAGYIRLLGRTTRWRTDGVDHMRAVLDQERGIIAGLWHGRLFLSPLITPTERRAVAMISRSRDGDAISALVGRFGIGCIRGSTFDRGKQRDKGGSEAFAEAEAEVRAGSVVAITPDGPRGPRMRAQSGIARLALATGAPVIPISFSTSRGRLLRSWDRFLLPLPFGRGAIVYGAPLWPRDWQGRERALREAIERAMTAAQDRADALCGREPVPPAAPER